MLLDFLPQLRHFSQILFQILHQALPNGVKENTTLSGLRQGRCYKNEDYNCDNRSIRED